MVAKNRLLVGDLLDKFTGGRMAKQLCAFCKSGVETMDHLFMDCKWSWSPWTICLRWWDVVACMPKSLSKWMEQ